MLPTSSRRIDTLSPSRLERLRCPAHVAFDQAGRDPGLSNAVAQLGTAVHLAVEFLLAGSSPAAAWAAACDSLTAISVDPRSLPGARRVALRFVRRAPQLLDLVAEIDAAEVLPEEELMSADGSIGGTADLLLLRPHDIVVIDHKTGIVSEAGLPKAVYEQQIRIYAALASERFGRPTTRGILMSMREGIVEVDVSPRLVAETLSIALEQRARYNARTPGSQPALPAPAVCVWCPHKTRCDAFWGAVGDDWVGMVGHCASVIVTKEPEIAANGLAALGCEVRGGTLEPCNAVVIAEVPADQLNCVEIGAAVKITGLRNVTDSPPVLRWTSASLLDRG